MIVCVELLAWCVRHGKQHLLAITMVTVADAARVRQLGAQEREVKREGLCL